MAEFMPSVYLYLPFRLDRPAWLCGSTFPSLPFIPAAANELVDGQRGASVVVFPKSSSQSSKPKSVGAVSIGIDRVLLPQFGLILLSHFSSSDQLEEAVMATFVKNFVPQWELSKKTK